MLFVGTTNVVSSRLPECQPTGTLTARVKLEIQYTGHGFHGEQQDKPF